MGRVKVVGCLVGNLSADKEDGYFSMNVFEILGLEVKHTWCVAEHVVIHFISQFGGQFEEFKVLSLLQRNIPIIFIFVL